MRPLMGLTLGIVALTVAGCAGSYGMAEGSDKKMDKKGMAQNMSTKKMAKKEMAAKKMPMKNMSHAHMGHVTMAWKGTPGNKGLLSTAMAEAKIAAQHAGFAASKPGNLGWMQAHTRHVLNAVDPSVMGKGPGLGYGVIRGAMGCAKHIGLAAKSAGASKNVKAHAAHVGASCQNTVVRAQQIMAMGKIVLAAKDAAAAAPAVMKIQMLASQLLTGRDANGDGNITWQTGEGGLNAAKKHMGFMTKGEGM